MSDAPVLDLWTIEDAAAELGMSRSAIHQWMRRGIVAPTYYLGKHSRPIAVFDAAALDRMRARPLYVRRKSPANCVCGHNRLDHRTDGSCSGYPDPSCACIEYRRGAHA